MSRGSWVPYAVLLVILSGIWGATSGLPTTAYGYPVEMVYVIWAAVMLIPASVLLRGASLDASPEPRPTDCSSGSRVPAGSCCS